MQLNLDVRLSRSTHSFLKHTHTHTDDSVVIARGKGAGGRVKEGRVGGMVVERDFPLDAECMMQCADNLLQNCLVEACTILLTNVTPINSIQNHLEHALNLLPPSLYR